MAKRLCVSVLCGGQSTEHEVSVRSAKNIVSFLDANKYDVSVVFIDHEGKWYLFDKLRDFLDREPEDLLSAGGVPITVALGDSARPWQSLNGEGRHYEVNCVFPIIHGTNGEDGSLQGLLDLLNLPYVGADAQSSAICMEKDITKRLLRAADIPVLDWQTLYPGDSLEGLYQKLLPRLGSEMFVKAASLGSSVGTMPVKTEREFQQAVKDLFRYDERVIVEPRVRGREIECSVLGNENPRASLPSEIVVYHDYYTYEAKYLDPAGARTVAPADLPSYLVKNIQKTAVDAFRAVHCAGMARVDFFLLNNEKLVVNELNTIPGFTSSSLYPKMWEVSGLPYRDLLDQLIELALQRHRYQQTLIRRYVPKG